jgi:hypothetical protein
VLITTGNVIIKHNILGLADVSLFFTRKQEGLFMDYIKWAKEYYESAEKIKTKIDQLKAVKNSNAEEGNLSLSHYQYIYYDLLHTAKMLEEKGKK